MQITRIQFFAGHVFFAALMSLLYFGKGLIPPSLWFGLAFLNILLALAALGVSLTVGWKVRGKND